MKKLGIFGLEENYLFIKRCTYLWVIYIYIYIYIYNK